MGPLPFAYFLLSRMLQVAFRGWIRLVVYRVYVQSLIDSQVALRSGYTLIEVNEGSDDERIAKRPEKILQLRRRLGYRCFGLRFKNEPIAYAWFATGGDYLEDEVRLRYVMADPEKTVWDFDIFVVPKSRAGWAFQQLWQGCGNRLGHEGFTDTASRIHLSNVNSILSHERLGARAVATLVVLAFGRVELLYRPWPILLRISVNKATKVMVDRR